MFGSVAESGIDASRERRVMKIDDMDLSPELREKAKACKTPDEMLALAKAEGYKLSEEELAAVSGGGRWSCSDLDDSAYKPWKDCDHSAK